MNISYYLLSNTRNNPYHFLNKLRTAIIFLIVISPFKLFAQVPVISYGGGQTYPLGTTISPLVPSAANVGTPGYAVSAVAPNPAMNTVLSVAKDSHGNVFVADQTNKVIKELPVGGGNPIAMGSGFNLPIAVAVDPSGNLFVADYYNNAVKEIVANTGATVSIGSGFVKPYNLSVDQTGNIYVADVSTSPSKKLTPIGGYFISPALPVGLKFDQTTGIISGSPKASSPQTTYTIFAYNKSGSGSTTITIAVSAPQAAPTISYNTPQSVSAGSPITPIIPSTTGIANIGYVSSPVAASTGLSNREIDVFLIMGQSNAGGCGDVAQSPPTVPGNIVYFGGKVFPANDPLPGWAALKAPYGSMWPALGNTYYELTGRHICFVQGTKRGSALIAAAELNGKGVWDATGTLYPKAATQLQLAIDSLAILGYAPVVKGFLWDQGEADAAALSNSTITPKAYTDTLVAFANRFRRQFGATLPFYILQSGAHNPNPPDFMHWVREAQDATMAVDSMMFVVTRNAATFPERNLMNSDPTLNVLHYSQPGYNELGVGAAQGVVLSQKNPVPIQIFPSSSAVANAGSVSNLPAGIATDATGNLYFSDAVNKAIIKVPASGGSPVTLGSGLSSPFGIAVDKLGNIFVADAGSNSIKKIPQTGGTPITIASGFNHPNGVAIDSYGNIFVADTYNNAVKEIPALGGPQLTIGSGFSSPFAVAIDQNGNIYVADAGNNAIKKIAFSGGGITILGGGFKKPSGVAVDKSGNVYVADEGNNAVKEIPLGSNNAIVLGPGYSSPFGIAVDTKGNIYAPDDSNNGIREISLAGGYYSIDHALPAGLSFDITTGIISGTPAAPSPSTNYTITATNNLGTKTAVVNLKITAKEALSNLLLNNGLTLSPAFAPGTTSYTVNVANTISSISLTPYSSDKSQTIYVNSTQLSSGTASASIPLVFGSNIITVRVVGADGAFNTYTVNLIRNPSSFANLSNLFITSGVLTPSFNASTLTYTAIAPVGVTSITVIPVAVSPVATITVNGVPVTSGSASSVIPLKVGTNTIVIQVTAQDKITVLTYTLTVTASLSTNANLAGLTPGSGSLSPVFSPTTTNYTENVAHSVTTMTVSPITAVTTATVKVDGAAVTSGSSSAPIFMIPGSNTIIIKVTAQDGKTTNTYTLIVNRAPLGASNLSEFNIGADVLSPVFNGIKAPYFAGATKAPALTEDGIVVHQALSPNGDGVNDFLVIDGVKAYPENKLSIINRNGQLIFEAKGYDNSTKVFDGHSSKTGQMQLPGTYFYQLDYTVSGVIKHKTGYLVLKY